MKDDQYTYLVGVLLSEDLSRIDCSWLIPMKDVLRLGSVRPTKVVLRASRARGSRDKYTAYRCDETIDLANRVVRIFNKMRS